MFVTVLAFFDRTIIREFQVAQVLISFARKSDSLAATLLDLERKTRPPDMLLPLLLVRLSVEGDIVLARNASWCIDHLLRAEVVAGVVRVGGTHPNGVVHTNRPDCGSFPQGFFTVGFADPNAYSSLSVEYYVDRNGYCGCTMLVSTPSARTEQLCTRCVFGAGGIEIRLLVVIVRGVPKTTSPSRAPTTPPTRVPTRVPTRLPTHIPTLTPTRSPTSSPSFFPTLPPTSSPTATPTSFFDSSSSESRFDTSFFESKTGIILLWGLVPALLIVASVLAGLLCKKKTHTNDPIQISQTFPSVNKNQPRQTMTLTRVDHDGYVERVDAPCPPATYEESV